MSEALRMKLLPYPGGLPCGTAPSTDTGPQAASREPASAGGDPGPMVLPRHASAPTAAGEVAQISLVLANAHGRPTACAINVTALMGPAGYQIPASHLRVAPNPANIAAGGLTDLLIEIRVPSAAPAGRYLGLLQADGTEPAQRLLQLVVTADSRSTR